VTTLTKARQAGRPRALATLVIAATASTLALVHLHQVRGYFDAHRNQHVQAIFAGSTADRFPVWDTRVSPPDPDRSLMDYEDRNPELRPDIFLAGDTLFYYFIPVAFKALGAQRPFFVLAIVFALLTAAAIGQAVWIGLRDGSAPVVILYIAIGGWWMSRFPGLNVISVYYEHFLAPLWLFGIATAVIRFVDAKVGLGRTMVFVVPLTAAVSISILVRNSVALSAYGAYAALFVAAIVAPGASARERRARGAKATAWIAGILLMVGGWRLLLSDSMLITSKAYQPTLQTGQHVVWHTLFCSLGALRDPRYPFEWSDSAGQIFVRSIDPDVTPYSREYESLLRAYIVRTLWHDPEFLWRYVWHQGSHELFRYLAALAVLLWIWCRWRYFSPSRALASTVLLAALLANWPIQLISIPLEVYRFPLHIGELLALGICVLFGTEHLRETWRRRSRGPVETVLAVEG
jgi:hypothetical protein